MKRIGTISRNAAALVGAKLLASGLSFLLAIVINKYLGPEKAGIYLYGLAIYTMFQVLPDFGLGNISIRDISQVHSRLRRYFHNIVPLRFVLGLVAFALLNLTNLIVYAFQSSSTTAGAKFWVALSISFCLLIEQPFSNSLAENFIALERLTTVAFVYMIMGIIKAALSIYVILADLGQVLVLLMLIYIITQIYSIFHFYLAYRRLLERKQYFTAGTGDLALAETITHAPVLSSETTYEAMVADYSLASLEEVAESPGQDQGAPTGTPLYDRQQPPPDDPSSYMHIGRLRWDRKLGRYLLNSAWPLAIASAGVTIYAVVDIPILSWLGGDKDVGMYGAAAMFSKAFVFLMIAINMAILPAISKVGAGLPQRLGKLWEHMLRYALILAIPLAVLSPILARPVLIMQEHGFIDAWHAVWLTMGAMIFTIMTSVSFPFFIVIDKQRKLTSIVAIGIGFKAALDFVAIPLWGYTGAAAVVLVSEIFVFVLIYSLLAREMGYRINLAKLLCIPVAVMGALYAAIYFLQRLFISGKASTNLFSGSLLYAFIIAAIVTILYVVLAVTTRLLNRKDLDELNELLTV